MTISEPHSPIFDTAEDLERRWDAGVESIVAAATRRTRVTNPTVQDIEDAPVGSMLSGWFDGKRAQWSKGPSWMWHQDYAEDRKPYPSEDFSYWLRSTTRSYLYPTKPLHVYSEDGRWWWGCRVCNWVSPQPSRTQPASFTRAEMHWDVAHAGPFNRSAL